MKKKTEVNADMHYFNQVSSMIGRDLSDAGCCREDVVLFLVAVEEIFSNIAFYAYPEGGGKVTVVWEFEPDTGLASMSFTDSGVSYNPLEKPDPDIALSAEDRPVGGLGIYMVKKSVDHVEYEYAGGRNILVVRKQFERR